MKGCFERGWIVFLSYVFIGGSIAQVIELGSFNGPFCDPDDGHFYHYECEPCDIAVNDFSIWMGGDCPNTLLQLLFNVLIGVPSFITMGLLFVLFISVTETAKNADLQYVLIGVSVLVIIRTLYYNLIAKRNIGRGLHRGLLSGCILLGFIHAAAY